MAVLDNGAFGAATEVTPVHLAADRRRWTGAHGGQASLLFDNYLIDVDNAIIVDVEATTAIRQRKCSPPNA